MTQPTNTDDELRSKVYEYAEFFTNMEQPLEGQDGWFVVWQRKFDGLIQLIQADRKKHELDARIDELEVKMDVYAFIPDDNGGKLNRSTRLAELKAEREKL